MNAETNVSTLIHPTPLRMDLRGFDYFHKKLDVQNPLGYKVLLIYDFFYHNRTIHQIYFFL